MIHDPDLSKGRGGAETLIDRFLVVAAVVCARLSGFGGKLAHVEVYGPRLVENFLPDEEANLIG